MLFGLKHYPLLLSSLLVAWILDISHVTSLETEVENKIMEDGQIKVMNQLNLESI